MEAKRCKTLQPQLRLLRGGGRGRGRVRVGVRVRIRARVRVRVRDRVKVRVRVRVILTLTSCAWCSAAASPRGKTVPRRSLSSSEPPSISG